MGAWVKNYTTAHVKLGELVKTRCIDSVSKRRKWR